MGQKRDDGRASNFVAPAATLIEFGELYRVDGITHVALQTVPAAATDRNYAGMVNMDEVWYVKIPVALSAARGAYLAWSTGGTFKSGQTDLVADATASSARCAYVEEAKDANNYAGIRIDRFNRA